MADYNQAVNTAKGQTQGWYNSQKTQRQDLVNQAQSAFDQVDPYYSQLFQDLGTNKTKAYDAMVAGTIKRGVSRGGIRTRLEQNMNSDYEKLGQRLGEEQRTKKTQMQGALDTAKKTFGDLDSEWNDKVNSLAYQIYNSMVDQEQRELDRQASLQSAKYSSGMYNQTPQETPASESMDSIINRWVPRHGKKATDGFDAVEAGGTWTRENMADQIAMDYGFDRNTVLKKLYGIIPNQYNKPANTGKTYDAYGREWQNGKLTGYKKSGNTIRKASWWEL